MNLAQDTIKEITCLYERAKTEYKKLTQKLSDNDREANDILHFIEFQDFTLDDGYTAVMKLKKLRLARRKIKDELEPLQILIGMLDSQKLSDIQNRIDNKINDQKNRHYTPRILLNSLG